MQTYSIKDLEQVSGIKAHTLRAWEQRYQIIQPQRTSTNIRFYDGEAMRKLLNVCLLQEHGLKISKIAKMSVKEIKDHVLFITKLENKFSYRVTALTLFMMEYNQDAFEDEVSACINDYGVEDTIMFVVYPFLQKIGYLWMTDAINPAQEHFVSNLIRAKLIMATEMLERPSASLNFKIIMFLPEGEFHETTLLFANYKVRKKGQKVLYLGQNLPFEDLVRVHEKYQPPYIFTSLTTGKTKSKAYIAQLAEAFPSTTILIAGTQVQQLAVEHNNVKLLLAPDDLVQYI